VIERLLRTGAMLLSPENSVAAQRIFTCGGGSCGHRKPFRSGMSISTPTNTCTSTPTSGPPMWTRPCNFLLRANHEFRDPSSRFNTRYYLSRYSAVADSGLNPLLHYALFGKTEGREVSPRQSAAPVRCLEPTPDGNLALAINNDWRRDYPLVTGVVPVYNNARFLERNHSLHPEPDLSKRRVDYRGGGSTDQATVAEVRRLESLQFPRTTFYFRPERHHVGDNKELWCRDGPRTLCLLVGSR
jgi:hypothetical protein